MSEHLPPTHTGDRYFRYLIGLLCILASLAGFGALYIVEIPPTNERTLMFALGVIFGWGSAVVGSEFGASTIGRRVAEAATRTAEATLSRPDGPHSDENEQSGGKPHA